MSDETQIPASSRRNVLRTLGALGVGGVSASTATTFGPVQSQRTTYTLTVTGPSGDFTETVSVEDTVPLGEYGGHLTYSTVGDSRVDNDSGIVDHVRLDDTDVIEDWETEGDGGGWQDSYHRTGTGGGEFRVTDSQYTAGTYALGLFSGCCGDAITSDTTLLSVSDGTSISVDISNQTRNSSTYAHKTSVAIGTDRDGRGGVRVELINPGSERTAGARLNTPNNEARIEFTPELQSFYTFRIEIGDTTPDAVAVSGRVEEAQTGNPVTGVPVRFSQVSGDRAEFQTESADSVTLAPTTGELVVRRTDQRGVVTDVSGPIAPGREISLTAEVEALTQSGQANVTYGVIGLSDGTVLGVNEMDGAGTGTVTVSAALPDDFGSRDLLWAFIPVTTERGARESFEGNPRIRRPPKSAVVAEPVSTYRTELPVPESGVTNYWHIVDADGYEQFVDQITISPDSTDIDAPVTLNSASETPGEETTVSVTTEQRDEHTETTVSITEATAGDPVEIPLDLRVSASTTLDELVVTPEVDGSFALLITSDDRPLDTTPAVPMLAVAEQLGFLSIDSTFPDTDIETVAYRYSLDPDAADTTIDSQDVALYRFEEDTDRWAAYPTELTGEGETLAFETTAPGFSEWVVGSDRPDISITDAEASVSTVQTGKEFDIDVTLRNPDEASDVYVTELLFEGNVVERRRPRVPADTAIILTFTRSLNQDGEYTVRVNNVDAGTVTVRDGEVTNSAAENRTSEPAASDTNEGTSSPPWPLVLGGLGALGGGGYLLRRTGEDDEN